MAITIRKGLKTDFDPTKMVRGEFAFCYDTGEVYLCESPGEVIKLGTADTIEAAVALCQNYATTASAAATSASADADNSEAWAVGQIDGTDVPSTDPRYHNNAKYWAEQAAQQSGATPATPTTLGIVKPDNTTINVDGNGVISGYALGETTGTVYEGSKGKANADNIATIQGLIPSTATTSNKLATASDIPSVEPLTSEHLTALRTIIQG